MRLSLARTAVVGVLMLALAYVVVAVSWGAVLRSRNPSLALKLAPWDARALARVSDQKVAANTSIATVNASAGLARRALDRDATIPGAWRMLGLSAAAHRDDRRAADLMQLAERMSRRDLPTQTWLIEERVRAGDTLGALRHYDIALRSVSSAANLLMPILVGASSDPVISKGVADLLKRNPPWTEEFLRRLANAPSADSATTLVEAAAIGAIRPLPPVYLDLANHYIGRRQYRAALRIFHLLAEAQGPIPALRDGAFDREGRFPPYNWRLANVVNPNVILASVPGESGHRLEVNATSGNGGVAAEQLLALGPGSYRVRAQKGTQQGVAQAQMQLRVECAGSGSSLARHVLGPRTSPSTFDVPVKGCPAQWLRIVLVPDFSSSDIGGWVDNIVLSKLR